MIAAGADAWQSGRVIQFADPTGAQHQHVPAAQPPADRNATSSVGREP